LQIIIIWPDTRIKFNTLEKQCQNIIKNEQVQHLVTKFVFSLNKNLNLFALKKEKNRFNFTLLTILNILLEFEREENVFKSKNLNYL